MKNLKNVIELIINKILGGNNIYYKIKFKKKYEDVCIYVKKEEFEEFKHRLKQSYSYLLKINYYKYENCEIDLILCNLLKNEYMFSRFEESEYVFKIENYKEVRETKIKAIDFNVLELAA